jgi:hypothetical protein
VADQLTGRVGVGGETDAALDLAERAVAWFASAGGGDGAALADETLAGLRAVVAGTTSVAASDGDRQTPVAQ